MSDYPVFPILRLLRFPNLVVVALTQWLVYYRVLQPAFLTEDIAGVLSPWKFGEIVLVTLAVTASGYLINDLQDEEIDAINRPGTNPVETLGRDGVTWAYGMTILAGFLVSQLLAYRLGERHLLWIYPLAVGTLLIYSSNVKRVPFLGNLLVAAFCAGVPGILVLAERAAVTKLFAVNPVMGQSALRICLIFMVFAFVVTMLRELVKDLEDLDGDRSMGRRTIPVLLGVERSRWLGAAFGVLAIVAISYPFVLGWPGFLTPAMMGLSAALIMVLLYILARLLRAREPQEYHRLSTYLKVFLLGGLALLAVF